MKFYQKLSAEKILGLLFFYPIIITVYPTVRILLFGSGASESIVGRGFGFTPDLYVYALLAISILNNKFKILEKSRYSLIDYCFISFFLINVIFGLAFSNNLKNGYLAFRLTYIPTLCYFILWLNFEPSYSGLIQKLTRRVFNWYFALAVLGLLLYFVFPGLEKYLVDRSGGKYFEYTIVRMSSIIYNPVPFATLLSVACLYYTYLIHDKPDKKKYAFFTILFLSLLLTVSRGGIFAYLIAASAYFVLHPFNKKSLYVISIWILSFILFSLFVSNIENLRAFVKSKKETPETTLQPPVSRKTTINIKRSTWIFTSAVKTAKMDSDFSRVQLWKRSFTDFKNRPFGYGFGNSGHIAIQNFGKHYKGKNAAMYATDGWFVKLVTETGLFGLLSYALLIGAFIITLFKQGKNAIRGFMLFLLCFVLLVNLQNTSSNVLDYFCFAPVFWLLLSVFSVYTKNKINV